MKLGNIDLLAIHTRINEVFQGKKKKKLLVEEDQLRIRDIRWTPFLLPLCHRMGGTWEIEEKKKKRRAFYLII